MVRIIALLEVEGNAAAVEYCLLAEGGYELSIVNSFELAKTSLFDNCYDLIISDVHLENGGSVFDFLRWVRKQPHLKEIPFVLLSLQPTNLAKYLADGVRLAARTLGAAKYISMEVFDPLALIVEIKDLLPGAAIKKTFSDDDEMTSLPDTLRKDAT